MTTLTVDDLLLGSRATHEVEVPPDVLDPAGGSEVAGAVVTIRPLVMADLQRIQRAGAESKALTSALMVQQALVEPEVTVEQVNRMPAGLVEHLLREVNRVSGLALTGDELTDAVQAPMARACFVLSRELGWSPEECAGLTVGQVLLYLELLGRGEWPLAG